MIQRQSLDAQTEQDKSKEVCEIAIPDIVQQIADAAWEKKALDLVSISVESSASYCDYFVICSGRSDRHVKAIVDSIVSDLKDDGIRILGVEGYQLGHWVLVDCNDVVVHVFYQPIRERYDLEGLWHDAKPIPLDAPEDLVTNSQTWDFS